MRHLNFRYHSLFFAFLLSLVSLLSFPLQAQTVTQSIEQQQQSNQAAQRAIGEPVSVPPDDAVVDTFKKGLEMADERTAQEPGSNHIALISLPGISPLVSDVLVFGTMWLVFLVFTAIRFYKVVTYQVFNSIANGNRLLAWVTLPFILCVGLSFLWNFIIGMSVAVMFNIPGSILDSFNSVLFMFGEPAVWVYTYLPATLDAAQAGNWYWHNLIAGYILWVYCEIQLIPIRVIAHAFEKAKTQDVLERITTKVSHPGASR